MTAFLRARAASVAILTLLVAAWTLSASGIDVRLPLPRLTNLFRPSSDEENQEEEGAEATVPPSTYAAGPAERADDQAYAPRTPERFQEQAPEPVDIDLSPQFSEFLPYSATLGRVVVEANFPLESAGNLEPEIVQLQKDLVGFLGVPEAREKIELCLFKDMPSYRTFIKQTFGNAPTDRPALYIKDGGPGVLMIPRDSNMILNIRHEMTHAYLNASLKNVPIWIDEGLAKYFEIPPGERGFCNPYLGIAEDDASGLFSSPPSLSRLEKLTGVEQMRTREYRESWSWVHYMLHYSPRTQRVLASYLRSLRPEAQQGITPRRAIELQKTTPMKRALEKYEPDYEREFVQHFKNWDQKRTAYERGRAGLSPDGSRQVRGEGI